MRPAVDNEVFSGSLCCILQSCIPITLCSEIVGHGNDDLAITGEFGQQLIVSVMDIGPVMTVLDADAFTNLMRLVVAVVASTPTQL